MMLLSALLASSLAYGQACTFNEAKIALENGHHVRGNALLRMAARDGDSRAIHMLLNTKIATTDDNIQKIDSSSQLLLVITSQSMSNIEQ